MPANQDDYTRFQPSANRHNSSLEDKINAMHADRRDAYRPEKKEARQMSRNERYGFDIDENPNRRNGGGNNRNLLIGIFVLLAIIVIGGIAWWIVSEMGNKERTIAEDNGVETIEGEDDASAKELELQQLLAQSEFENLEREFAQYETSQQQIIVNDTLKEQLQQKYEQARLQVEELRAKLKDTKAKSAAEIQSLNDQIKTLRELLKHYLEEIDRLNKENEQLRNENEDLRQSLNQTTTNLHQAQTENEKLNQRMTLAEKLNVTGVSMNMLNKKNKNEKKIKNAKQFVINFTIPQNNSTPVGTKTIYAVITTPEGQILDGGGSFSYDGSNVTASARRQIDYGGEEIGGITMYYDIRNALSPGTYSVQLFCDGYALMSRPLQVQFNN